MEEKPSTSDKRSAPSDQKAYNFRSRKKIKIDEENSHSSQLYTPTIQSKTLTESHKNWQISISYQIKDC